MIRTKVGQSKNKPNSILKQGQGVPGLGLVRALSGPDLVFALPGILVLATFWLHISCSTRIGVNIGEDLGQSRAIDHFSTFAETECDIGPTSGSMFGHRTSVLHSMLDVDTSEIHVHAFGHGKNKA